jgi:hypothetical protein
MSTAAVVVAPATHPTHTRLFLKLDWLILLAEGHLMYYGSATADQVGCA